MSIIIIAAAWGHYHRDDAVLYRESPDYITSRASDDWTHIIAPDDTMPLLN